MTKAIVKKTLLEKAEEQLTVIRGACVGLAGQVASLKKPESLGRALVDLKAVSSAIVDMQKSVEERIKEFLAEKGEVVTDKGSRAFTANGVTLTMRPTRTGIDSKKLEKLLRQKGAKLTDYMDEHVDISFRVNMGKIESAPISKKLTAEEIEQCLFDESWSLQPVKREDTSDE